MDRKTWDSLPDKFRPLPNRRNIVITRNPNWHADGAQVCFSLTQALSLPDIAQQARVFVIGGAQIYAEALPHADMLLLTQVHTDTEGDAFFPRWDPQDFKETARENHPSSSPTDLAWSWVTYQRVR
jgi:dihydrofolate reductase